MAEIPVDRKSGVPGWVWVLLALFVLALLAWWILDDDDGDVVEYTGNDVVAEQSVDTMAAGSAAGALMIGEAVDLDNVRVTSLVGDMAFNADVNGQNMLVLFNQEPTPGDATEGEYDINPGSIINMTGTVRSAADGVPANVTAQIPAGTEKYIFADTIKMVN